MIHPLVKSKDKKERNEGIIHEVTNRKNEGIIELFNDVFDRLEELEKKSVSK